MLLTKINVHVLTNSISCRHPISVLSIVVILLSSLFCCSIVKSTALFCCVVYFLQSIALSCCSVIVQSIVLFLCPVYCVMLFSSLLGYTIVHSTA